MTTAQQPDLKNYVEGGDGVFVIRGAGNCRSWNNIQYKPGLSAKNVPAQKLSMNVATIPPGGVAYAHVHVGFEVMLYIMKGRVRHEYGPGLKRVIDNEAGLLWFANQRAVEFHPTLVRTDRWDRMTHLVLDLDPPTDGAFPLAVQAAHLVRQALADAHLEGAVKTSGAKGVHIFVPLAAEHPIDDAAAAARALVARAERIDPSIATTAFMKEDRGGKVFLDSTRAGGATVVSVYSPRVRPGLTVSFPVDWADLDQVQPADFTVRTALDILGEDDPWARAMPDPVLVAARTTDKKTADLGEFTVRASRWFAVERCTLPGRRMQCR